MTDPATALVTGAAGFFGQAIVRALGLAGVSVVATDRLPREAYAPRPGTPLERVTYERRDLTHEGVADLVAVVDGVVHAAALTLPDERGAAADDLLATNLAPLPGLLSAIRLAPTCQRLILVSSAGVYDQSVEGTLAENAADGGTGLYGAAKLAAELIAARYCNLHGIEHAAVRPTSLFGPGEVERASRPRVTPLAHLVRHAIRDEPVRLERAAARCDWLAVDDAADAIVTLWQATHLEGGPFNLSSGQPRTFAAVAEAVGRVAGLRLAAEATAVDGGADRPACIDNGAIRAAIGWQPRRSLDEAIGDLVAELRKEGAACST